MTRTLKAILRAMALVGLSAAPLIASLSFPFALPLAIGIFSFSTPMLAITAWENIHLVVKNKTGFFRSYFAMWVRAAFLTGAVLVVGAAMMAAAGVSALSVMLPWIPAITIGTFGLLTVGSLLVTAISMQIDIQRFGAVADIPFTSSFWNRLKIALGTALSFTIGQGENQKKEPNKRYLLISAGAIASLSSVGAIAGLILQATLSPTTVGLPFLANIGGALGIAGGIAALTGGACAVIALIGLMKVARTTPRPDNGQDITTGTHLSGTYSDLSDAFRSGTNQLREEGLGEEKGLELDSDNSNSNTRAGAAEEKKEEEKDWVVVRRKDWLPSPKEELDKHAPWLQGEGEDHLLDETSTSDPDSQSHSNG